MGRLMWGITENPNQWVVEDSGTAGNRNLKRKRNTIVRLS